MTNNKTIIDLNIDDRTGKVSDESIIQKALIDQCISTIKGSINATRGIKDTNSDEAPILQSGENVYFVDGSRGAGKTTFMRSLRCSLETDKDIYTLDLIDPTKFKAPMGILVSVISLLNSAVEKARKTDFHWGKQSNDYTEWQEVLHSLAKGIKSYGNDTDNIDCIDDVLNLSRGIDYSFSSLTLSQQCHDLFGKAAKIIGCKAFLLPFDDVDTNFSSGWGVLETIRSQLTSSRIVTLITGDIQLYTHLVRGKQFDNFSDSLFQYDVKRQNERELMVDHLEQQYLLKLFPVENRFRLKTLGQLVSQDKHQIAIKNWLGDNNSDEKSLQFVIAELISDGLNLKESNKEYIAEYANYIIQSPVRLNLQLISRYNTEVTRDLKIISDNESNQFTLIKPKVLNATLNSLMGSSLFKAGIDNIELSKLNLSFICNAVFDYSLCEGDLNTSFYLRPNSSQEYLRNISITLASSVAASLTGSISNSLRYIFSALGSVSLFDISSKLEAKKNSNHDKELFIKLFADYMGIARDESLSNWASHAPACISQGGKSDKGIYPGVIQFNRHTRKYYLKNKKADSYSIFKYQKETDLAYLAAAAASSESVANNTRSFFSLYSLIAAIDELMNVDDFTTSSFVKASTVPSVTEPNWSIDVLADTAEENTISDADTEEEKLEATLSEPTKDLFKSWRKNITSLNENYTPSALLMGKIWSRLYFNLESIKDKHFKKLAKNESGNLSKSSSNAAILMRYNVIALLNAVLFEEDKYHKREKNCSLFDSVSFLANPVDSGKEFCTKLAAIKDMTIAELNKQYPLFIALASCPLILPYIFAKNSCYNTPIEKRYDSKISNFFINIMLAYNEKFIDLEENPAEYYLTSQISTLPEHENSTIKNVADAYGFKTLYKAFIAEMAKGSLKDSVHNPAKNQAPESAEAS